MLLNQNFWLIESNWRDSCHNEKDFFKKSILLFVDKEVLIQSIKLKTIRAARAKTTVNYATATEPTAPQSGADALSHLARSLPYGFLQALVFLV